MCGWESVPVALVEYVVDVTFYVVEVSCVVVWMCCVAKDIVVVQGVGQEFVGNRRCVVA